MDLKTLVADSVKKHRQEIGMTQEKLAEHAGINERYLQKLEAGENQPTVSVLFQLCLALNTTPEKLLTPIWENWKDESK